MTSIRATCYLCGEVDLPSNQVVATETIFASGSTYEYQFDCPDCGAVITRVITAEVFALLERVPVLVYVDLVPAEYFEPHCGPPLAPDDLLDLVLALSQSDFPQLDS